MLRMQVSSELALLGSIFIKAAYRQIFGMPQRCIEELVDCAQSLSASFAKAYATSAVNFFLNSKSVTIGVTAIDRGYKL